jgi:hypothetical protein
LRLTPSITNVFNRVGQRYHGYIVPVSVNDALGRRFAVSVGKHWQCCKITTVTQAISLR